MSDGQSEVCKGIEEQNPSPISPLPWRHGNAGSIVCDDPRRNGLPDEGKAREFYGGDVVCESIQPSDANFILRLTERQIPLPTDPLARFVALEKQRRELEKQLDDLKDELAKLQETVLDDWADRCQQSAKVDGLTVYVSHEFYCTKRGEISTEQLIEILRSSGLDRCVQVGYNASSLKAFVKEQIAGGSDIPEALKKCLNFDTIPRLRTRLA